MLNIYSLLIPVKNHNGAIWLIKTDSFVNKVFSKVDNSLIYLTKSKQYYFPFNQCRCVNHAVNSECIKYICEKVKVNYEQILGYVFLSNRTIDTQSYTFSVLLCAPALLEDLTLSNVEYSLYKWTDNNVPLLGPEVSLVVTSINSSNVSRISMPILPIESFQNLSLNYLLSKMETSGVIKIILKDIRPTILQAIYSEFMSYCYPSFEMGEPQFQQFMIRQKIMESDIALYFRCFDTASEGFISYEKFLIGVTCMDFNTLHGGQAGELRCRYIFSLYDQDRDGLLSKDDLRNMIYDINSRKGKSTDEESIKCDHLETLRIFGLDDVNTKVDLEKFLLVVGNLLFRGTSVLFRFDPEVSYSNRLINERSEKDGLEFSFGDKLNDSPRENGDLWKYTLAVHSAKVHFKQDAMMIRPIWDDIHNYDQLGEFGDKFNLTISRLHSINTFNGESCPNEILEALKYFRHSDSKNNKREMSWGDISMDILAKYLNLLCDDVENIIMKEPNLLEIQSPVYVLGDIHGNFSSMSKFEDILWRLGVGLSPAKFLFLGDYVDRGKYGIEVIAYLFAQKVLYPNQIFLLRGNHEIRSIQEQYTFKRECIDKFGEACGICLWNTINDVFDLLPLAAVIDERLFCIHGGIPRPSLLSFKHSEGDPLLSLRYAINKVKTPLPDPEQGSALAWEMMWSDPYRENECDITDESLPSDNTDIGFVKNQRRKTAYCFNHSALESFLSRYNFSHVIRAHEVQRIGFNVEHHAKLVTVFSSTDYCHNNNEAACVLVSNKKLRLIRIDTTE